MKILNIISETSYNYLADFIGQHSLLNVFINEFGEPLKDWEGDDIEVVRRLLPYVYEPTEDSFIVTRIDGAIHIIRVKTPKGVK